MYIGQRQMRKAGKDLVWRFTSLCEESDVPDSYAGARDARLSTADARGAQDVLFWLAGWGGPHVPMISAFKGLGQRL